MAKNLARKADLRFRIGIARRQGTVADRPVPRSPLLRESERFVQRPPTASRCRKVKLCRKWSHSGKPGRTRWFPADILFKAVGRFDKAACVVVFSMGPLIGQTFDACLPLRVDLVGDPRVYTSIRQQSFTETPVRHLCPVRLCLGLDRELESPRRKSVVRTRMLEEMSTMVVSWTIERLSWPATLATLTRPLGKQRETPRHMLHLASIVCRRGSRCATHNENPDCRQYLQDEVSVDGFFTIFARRPRVCC